MADPNDESHTECVQHPRPQAIGITVHDDRITAPTTGLATGHESDSAVADSSLALPAGNAYSHFPNDNADVQSNNIHEGKDRTENAKSPAGGVIKGKHRGIALLTPPVTPAALLEGVNTHRSNPSGNADSVIVYHPKSACLENVTTSIFAADDALQESYFSQRSPSSTAVFQVAVAPCFLTPDEGADKSLSQVIPVSLPSTSDHSAASISQNLACGESRTGSHSSMEASFNLTADMPANACFTSASGKGSSSNKLPKYERYVPAPPGTFISSKAGILRSEVQARLVVHAQRKATREEDKALRRRVALPDSSAIASSSVQTHDDVTISIEPPSRTDASRKRKPRDTSKWSYSRKTSRFWMKANREHYWPYARLGIAELDCFGAGLLIDATDWYTSPMEDRYPHLKAQKILTEKQDDVADLDAKDEAELNHLVKQLDLKDRKRLVDEEVVIVN